MNRGTVLCLAGMFGMASAVIVGFTIREFPVFYLLLVAGLLIGVAGLVDEETSK